MGRDPTDCEVFDMAQSNSEHSRHWFFSGRQVIDGVEKDKSLFKLVKETVEGPLANRNSIIAFHDNSSAIAGFATRALLPTVAGAPCAHEYRDVTYHPILTAETHNFPCGIAPFPGAETGTGGRIRDVQATGCGAHVIAGVSAYCVGSLHIPGYELPWEDVAAAYPPNMASPLQIEIDASNGASDYGNKVGARARACMRACVREQ
jgi:phosphoribosylformylglycinamidine synthase